MIESGRFGDFGGFYVSELLLPCLEELEEAWFDARKDASYQQELAVLLRDFAGRPTPLYRSAALSNEVGCHVYLKREDLLHGGAHKTNNTVGQALLARRMGKHKLIAETGAGQHGVATAMAGALFGFDVTVFMGAVDVARQRPNVQRMELFGAKVRPVTSGSASLKDAINETLRYWTEHVQDTFYVFGTAAGPHPYPTLVRDLQRVIGDEIKQQLDARGLGLPKVVAACVGGGSNAIGAFTAFLQDDVRLIGVEAAGSGLNTDKHAATIGKGRPGCLHGSVSYLLQDADGQVQPTHSVSAGLDYPGVGPQHSFIAQSGRGQYVSVTDDEALHAFHWLSRHDGIVPALESAHAIAAILRMKGEFDARDVVVINLSGRGDKDLDHVAGLSSPSSLPKEQG